MPNPVVHFEIAGRDGKQSQAFYAALFDWEIDGDSMPGYGVVRAGGEGGIGGGIMTAPEGTGPSVTIYVMVDDLQAYLAKAESLGGKTLVPPSPIPGVGEFALFADPDGNAIGLFKGQG